MKSIQEGKRRAIERASARSLPADVSAGTESLNRRSAPRRHKVNINVNAAVRSITCLAMLFLFDFQTCAQDQTPPAASATSVQSGDQIKSDDQKKTAKPADPSPAPKTDTDFWSQEEMTGNWGGTRSKWKDKGVDLQFSLSQFYQGVASGGIETGSEYNGKFESLFKFDLGKLAGWKFWSAEIQTQTRFGGPLLTGTGTISPVNTAVIVPGGDGSVFSI